VNAVMMVTLADHVAHWPGPAHGVALCGAIMEEPWMAGPAATICDVADDVCRACLDRVPPRELL
jgi:hypothetical protein